MTAWTGHPDRGGLPWYWEHTARPERIHALAAHDLADPGLRADLDALAAATAHRTGHPVAVVNAVLTDAQLALGSYGVSGWAAGGLPLECGFCLYVVLGESALVVPDVTTDPRGADNPLLRMGVTGSYCGAPIVDSPTGEVLGALCVLDPRPGACGTHDLPVLREQAAVAGDLLARVRVA